MLYGAGSSDSMVFLEWVRKGIDFVLEIVYLLSVSCESKDNINMTSSFTFNQSR